MSGYIPEVGDTVKVKINKKRTFIGEIIKIDDDGVHTKYLVRYPCSFGVTSGWYRRGQITLERRGGGK